MKKTIFFWLFLCSFFSISYATKPMQFKFGDISMSDMEMKECPFDKDAPAIVLLDQTIGNLEITNSLFFVCEYHLRIKILKKSGLDYANYSFLISNNDRINKIKASTFNLEGGNIVETPVDNENIIKYKRSKYQNEMKIMFPKVSEGSIIELYYKIVTPNRYYPPNCYFQRDIPVAFGECYFDMSEYIVFKFFVNGDKNLFNDKNYKNLCDGRIFHFRVHDIPAFVPEKYMTSDVDNLLSINFEISDIKSYARNYEMTPTYGNLHQKLLANQYFGGELDHIDFLKKYTQEVIQNTNNYLERLKKIN